MNDAKTSREIKPVYVPLTKSERRNKFIFLFFGLIAFNVFVFGAFYLSTHKVNQEAKIATKINAALTPFPFQEMTIPYLRAREYKSSLGEKSQISQSSTYTSYLTSYDSDGLKINGLLTIPAGEAPKGGWPAIVVVHGYIPPKSYQTLSNYVAFVDYLASNGFVVFKIDLRGHGDSEGNPGGGYYSSDYVIDTLNARSALVSSDFVNPKRIGLWGHSMAGNIVSRALGARPDIPATVIWAGAGYSYTDLQKYQIHDNSYQPLPSGSPSTNKRQLLTKNYGQFDPNSSFWKLVPMTNYLKDIKGAISLNHDVDDDVVNIGYSRDLNALLDKTSIKHELNEYPSGGHNFTGATFDHAMANTVRFFNENL